MPVILVRQHAEGPRFKGVPKVMEGIWEFFAAEGFHGLNYQPPESCKCIHLSMEIVEYC